MCTVSMVMDHYTDIWGRRLIPSPAPFFPSDPNREGWPVRPASPARPITDDELDEFRRLLERAREYDRKNNEPDCELDEKRQALKKLAEQMGVDIAFV